MKTKALGIAFATLTSASLLFPARADIITGLQTYWRFDDGSGSSTAVDFTGYGNTGTLTNFADPTYTSMWTTGEVGGALLVQYERRHHQLRFGGQQHQREL